MLSGVFDTLNTDDFGAFSGILAVLNRARDFAIMSDPADSQDFVLVRLSDNANPLAFAPRAAKVQAKLIVVQDAGTF